MADTVTSQTLVNTSRRLVMNFTNKSDATGENGVTKVTISSYTGPNGLVPSKFAIEHVDFSNSGMEVLIQFDRSSLNTALILGNTTGSFDFKELGNLVDTGTGGTGNIKFTTVGAVANSTYDITLHLKKKD